MGRTYNKKLLYIKREIYLAVLFDYITSWVLRSTNRIECKSELEVSTCGDKLRMENFTRSVPYDCGLPQIDVFPKLCYQLAQCMV